VEQGRELGNLEFNEANGRTDVKATMARRKSNATIRLDSIV
jgi:hypothetical protein